MFPRIFITTLNASLLVLTLRADTSAIEREFARERETLTCVNGSTDEPSCGGTDMIFGAIAGIGFLLAVLSFM